jgi:hypothetical protein
MNPTPPKSYPAELRDQILRAAAGDAAALPAVKAAFDEHPELVAHFGDLASKARESLLDLIHGNDLTSKEAARRHAASLREELIGDHPSPVVRLLADRASITWLDTHGADLALAAQLRSNPGDLAFVRALCCRADSAQRRFVAALKAVATVTKLLPRRPPSPLELLQVDVPETPPTCRRTRPPVAATKD